MGILRRRLFSFRQLHPISRIPWSSIRRIGQSRLLALTIVVPFLGSLLLFNQHVVDVLTLSPEAVKRFITGVTPDADTSRQVTLNRLYYVYFGLCFLGIGSGLFAMLCPLEIKTYDSSRTYIHAESDLASRARMGIILPTTAKQFHGWFGDEYPDDWSLTRQLGRPNTLHDLFSQVIVGMYIEVPPENKPEEEPQDGFGGGHFTDHRGRPDVFKIAPYLYMPPTTLLGFFYEMQELASRPTHKNDILMLHYIALDHTKPWSRVVVTTFYTVGFLTLLWPTAMTFIQLSLSAMR